MSRPPKPYAVLKNEKKSHRTKKELNQRKQGEEGLLSGVILKENSEVRANLKAHKEFSRVNKLLKNINKNDAIYGAVINRYCMILAEGMEMENKREELFSIIQELKNSFEIVKESFDDLEPKERSAEINSFARSIAKMSDSLVKMDAQIQSKRKMLLDIEKENCMTIASALRSIPKQEDGEDSNPLLQILADD